MATKKQRIFQQRLLAWFQKNKRDLPWRKTRDPYRILVSEIMLQQTQVDRVVPKYAAFLKKFPTVQKLAAANQSTVIKLWSGLGYNNRAVRLHQAAKIVVQKYAGTFPAMFERLRALPGLGAYTARATLAFAFGKHVAAVDVNHARVVRRVFSGLSSPSVKKLDAMTSSLIPIREAYRWNHALMDFGALICKARPHCNICPLQKICSAYPAVLTIADRTHKKQEAFSGSNRFFRGRMVTALSALPHGKTIPLMTLWSRLNEQHNVLPERFTALARALEKDGVVCLQGQGRTRRIRLA